MLVMGALLTRNFMTGGNIINLMRRISINGVMAAGFTVVLLAGGFDLSIGSTLSLCAVLMIGLEKSIGSLPALVIVLFVGCAMGCLNGTLMWLTRGGTGEAFLITLGTALLGTSLALTYTNGYDLYGVKALWYKALGQGSLWDIPIATLIWIGILLILQIFIKKTIVGKKLILAGSNKKAAFLVGIDVNKYKMGAFMVAGLCASIAAILMTSRTTAASPRSGEGADFDAAIAAIIGGNSLIGGKGGMVQVMIGVLIYGLITNILNLAGIDSVMQFVFKGVILAIAIGLDGMKKSRI